MDRTMFKFKGHWINKTDMLYVEMTTDKAVFYFKNEVTLSLTATEAELKALDITLAKVAI